MTEKRPAKIAATLIVGDNLPEEVWHRLIQSMDNHVDHIFVHYNGKQEKFPYPQLGSTPITWQKFKWEDDFSLARNQNFAMVPKDEYDWILWIDSDDELVNGAAMQEMIASLDPESQGVFLEYIYSFDTDTGVPIVTQWRERLLRTDVDWIWQGPIHETAISPAGTQLARRNHVSVKHWRQQFFSDKDSRARNRRILAKARKAEPDNDRITFYLANEIYAEAHASKQAILDMGIENANSPGVVELYNTAQKLYTDFVTRNPSTDEGYIANHRRAECYRELGQHEQAININLQGLKLRPTWPESIVGIAQSFMELSMWDQCRDFAGMAIKVGIQPETIQVHEPLTLHYTPYALRGIAYENLGEYDKAEADYKKALEFFNHPPMQRRLEGLEFKRGGKTEKESVRKIHFNKQPEKSIAFITRPIPEDWDSETIARQGSGGAESCVYEVARRFAADGWRSVIFGNPASLKDTKDDEGIEWYHTTDFLPTEKYHTVVSNRAPEIFDLKVQAENKILWMHDVNVGDIANFKWGNRFDRCDKVIALTNWHKNHLSKLYEIAPSKISVVPNGFNPEIFSQYDEEKYPHRFVWMSSPDRGLDILLGMWEEIKEEWENADLLIFYGWAFIDKILQYSPNSPIASFKEGMMEMIQSLGGEAGGIKWKDRLPREQLAWWLSKASVWSYPSYFCETFCLAALETQAAGLIPVATDLAALNETVGLKEFLVPGYPNNESYRKEYMKTLKKVVNAPEAKKSKWRAASKRYTKQYTWDNAYIEWQDLLGISSDNIKEKIYATMP